MSKRRWSVGKVIAAWHGPLTIDAIAVKSGRGSESTIRRIWRTAQTAGRLPLGYRPHFPPTAKISAAPGTCVPRDILAVASVAPAARWPACVAAALLHFAGLP